MTKHSAISSRPSPTPARRERRTREALASRQGHSGSGEPVLSGGADAAAVTAAISGAGFAHQEQIKKFGTSQTIADAFGVAPFFQRVELGRFHHLGEKREYVLLRLKKENVPLIDVAIIRRVRPPSAKA